MGLTDELFLDETRTKVMLASVIWACGFFGGTAPLFATYLIDKTHLQLAPAFYMIAAGLLAFVVIWFMPSEDGSISQDEEAEPAPT